MFNSQDNKIISRDVVFLEEERSFSNSTGDKSYYPGLLEDQHSANSWENVQLYELISEAADPSGEETESRADVSVDDGWSSLLPTQAEVVDDE